MHDTAARKLLKPVGESPAKVDPYWDFEHAPSEGYDAVAKRLLTTRVFVIGRPADVRFELARADAPTGQLPVEECLFRQSAEEPTRFEPVGAAVAKAKPPSRLFAINVSRLGPGYYTLSMSVGGDAPLEKAMRFSVTRRPFYSFQDPAKERTAAEAPVLVRSSTGLVELEDEEGKRLVAAHEWDVYESAWNGSIPAMPYAPTRLRVVALTWFDGEARPVFTGFTIFGERAGESPIARVRRATAQPFLPPGRHEHGLRAPNQGGLPFPTLLGLPAQPDEGGRFASAAAPPPHAPSPPRPWETRP